MKLSIKITILILFSTMTNANALLVDNSTNCNGLTNCFVTIQEAVNNAQTDDEIRIFPGIYPEAVDLSLMGSELGKAKDGKLSFFTVDSKNELLARTAQVVPVTGPAFTHSNSLFDGDIVFDGLVVIATDDDGIDLDFVNGDITIRNMTASGNDRDGIDLELASGSHTMSISDTITENNGSHGLNLDGPDGSIAYIKNTQANNNVGEGISVVSSDDGDILDVMILDSRILNNGNDSNNSAGIEAWFEGKLIVKNITSSGNRGPGLAVIDATQTDITDSVFENNAVVEGFSGIFLVSAGTFSVDRSVFNGNGDSGINVYGTNIKGNELTDFTVNCSSFSGNEVGVYLNSTPSATASYNINLNNFSNQSIAAIHAGLDNDSIDASNNWWNDSTGPTHTNNPSGLGDNVSDMLDAQIGGAQGTVIYTPFSAMAIDIEQYPIELLVDKSTSVGEAVCRIPEYNVAVNVAGLSKGVTLSLMNNAEPLDITENGLSLFNTTLDNRSEYFVSITAQPNNPNQTCLITSDNATGNIDYTDVLIEVDCMTIQYNVGGSVTGLHSGNQLVIQNNNAEELIINTNGEFNFIAPYDDLQGYEVSIITQPTSPNQQCLLTKNSGTVTGADVTSVTIACDFGDDLIFKNGFELNK